MIALAWLRSDGHHSRGEATPLRCRTMTLVDLPGLAKNPVGDQPTDIERRIRSLVHTYIRHPTCLILAVSPANVDLVNSDALEMARSVDPEGFRTIGALLGPDLVSSTRLIRSVKACCL